MERRDFLRLSAWAAAVLSLAPWRTARAAPVVSGPGPYGVLLDPDANGIRLPAGFASRVLARAGEPVAGTGHHWHRAPDGGATFRVRGGWIYVSNSEATPGGVGAIRFDRFGAIVDAYTICSGTAINCAGGATPWGTWLTCEEFDSGHVWECDPTGETAAVKRPALGGFSHEAAAVDRRRRHVYLTEDETDGRLYRFAPERWPRLESGRLEVAVVGGDGAVTWAPVPDPDPLLPLATPTRHQVAESTPFQGGEGIYYHRSHVYFTTKGDNRVWDYDVRDARLSVIYDAAWDPELPLRGVDNVVVARSGDLVVAEDGGNMELVVLTPDGVVAPLLRVTGQAGSELTGPAFDATGRRLYFSSQRGGGNGITYEVSGPFRRSPRPLR